MKILVVCGSPHKNGTTNALADADEWAMDGIVANYDAMIRYLGWESLGKLCALGCAAKEQLSRTQYLEEAVQLAKTI